MCKKTLAIASILVLIVGLVFLLTACKKPAAPANDSMQPALEGQDEIPPGTVIKQTTGQIKFKVTPPDNGSSVSV